jgi:hypothetical protein
MTAKQIDDVTPAFPANSIILPSGDIHWGEAGMSLRDYFAGQALIGLLSNPTNDPLNPDEYASDAYKIANAMMKMRKQ